MNSHTYTLNEIKAETRRELKMRRQVWPRVTGMPESFISMKHQRQYDILKQFSETLEFSNERNYRTFAALAENEKQYQLKKLEQPNLFTT